MDSFFDRDLLQAPAEAPLPVSELRLPLTSDDVRATMQGVIDRLKRADTMPYHEQEIGRHIAMFPIMAKWFSPEEGSNLLAEFKAEVDRLGQELS